MTAYAHTDMDGTLLPYYAPQDTVVCKFKGTSASYQIFAQHSLRLMASDSSGRGWIDYANYAYVAMLALQEQLEVPFFGPGPAQPSRDQSISIGGTWVATWLKGEK